LHDCEPCSAYETGKLQPAWSPDGTSIAYASANWYPPTYYLWAQVNVVALSSTGNPDEDFYYGEHVEIAQPSWSPDSNKLVFTHSTGLLVLQATGQVSSLLQGNYRHPVWSSDGSMIAFEANGNVAVIPSAGGVASQVTTQGGTAPSWSPDGSEIAYSVAGTVSIVAALGGEPRQLVAGTDPAWSPDGNWIAFTSSVEGDADIWVIASTGGTPVRITQDPADETDPTWAPDGQSLAYTSSQGDCSCIWIASDLPDWTISVEDQSWSVVKGLYR
jgi:Tol biopolymer transport system component